MSTLLPSGQDGKTKVGKKPAQIVGASPYAMKLGVSVPIEVGRNILKEYAPLWTMLLRLPRYRKTERGLTCSTRMRTGTGHTWITLSLPTQKFMGLTMIISTSGKTNDLEEEGND